MPDPKTQRLIGWLAFAGVLATCFGCGLFWQNQVVAAVIAFVIADLIIIPTFLYLLTTRRRLKKVVKRTEEAQLDALAGVGEVMAESKGNEGAKSNS